jgi:hypothetical protein
VIFTGVALLTMGTVDYEYRVRFSQ